MCEKSNKLSDEVKEEYISPEIDIIEVELLQNILAESGMKLPEVGDGGDAF
jgi:hypothetical protein